MIIALTDGELNEQQLVAAQQEVRTLARIYLDFYMCFLHLLECCCEGFWGEKTWLLLLFFLSQAARARALGAIVYCVGVKDFNETQVKIKVFFCTQNH